MPIPSHAVWTRVEHMFSFDASDIRSVGVNVPLPLFAWKHLHLCTWLNVNVKPASQRAQIEVSCSAQNPPDAAVPLSHVHTFAAMQKNIIYKLKCTRPRTLHDILPNARTARDTYTCIDNRLQIQTPPRCQYLRMPSGRG